MRPVAAALLCLPLSVLAPPPSVLAGYTETAAACRVLFRSAEPRRGVSHRWLSVVPLVLTGPATATDPAMPASGMSWTPSPRPGAPGRAALKATAAPGGAPAVPELVPAGTILLRESDERLTLSPSIVPDDKPVMVDASPVTTLVEGPKPSPTLVGWAGRLPPIEFRRTAFGSSDPGDLRDLLAVEAILVGRQPTQERVSLSSLEESLPDRTGPAASALLPLKSAYGGEVVGHVVFLGNRVVELVVTAGPAIYQSILAAEFHAIGFSLVAWEEVYGLDGPRFLEPDWEGMLKESSRLLRVLAEPSLRPVKRDEPRPGEGDLWRVKAAMRPGHVATEVGWLLSDAAGRAVLCETWIEGGGGLMPPPAATPGGTPDGDDPNEPKGGGTGPEFLKRVIKRLKEMEKKDEFETRIQQLERMLEAFEKKRGQ